VRCVNPAERESVKLIPICQKFFSSNAIFKYYFKYCTNRDGRKSCNNIT